MRVHYLLAFLLIPLLSSCKTSPDTKGGKALLNQEVTDTITQFKQKDPTLETFFKTAYGYAVFPSIGKGGFGVGGAFGQGELIEQGQVVGFCSLSQGTIGLQAGGQSFSEIIFFDYKESLDYFKTGNFAFAAQASAVLVTAGSGASADYDRGVAVFVMPLGGLMFEASIGGQQFRYEPK